MRGRTHLYAGWLAGLGVAVVSGVGLAATAVLGTVAAGAALAPDIDHPESTASTAFGAVGRIASRTVGTAGRTVYRGTGGRVLVRPDRPAQDGGHRGITHTLGAVWLAAIATDLLVPEVGTGALIGTAVLLAGSGLMLRRAVGRDGWTVPLGLLVLGVLIDPSAAVADVVPLLPYAVAAGWASHLLLDAGTPMGVPLLGPIGGWRYVRLPWTTPCGSDTEEGLIQPAFLAVAVALSVVLIANRGVPAVLSALGSAL
ncbi:metal-dependent hydrolase [Actinoalloteichus sp. GBA129-24]|uniref:metal-dependent hydrolase n=1 Tax=Actinoalloteichus sp. GBA129-24 TaxID=1612551 RepID=UPI0009504E82|nr:metal-dependent hydrolase [Actinoalloteichus sp. GBA129-24]APU20979.1 putative membrane-bound metal-dependent hydrolase (DUF457) [Actinoalloteichus sp. GBA129-24]APU24228.1 putative membrane-bound metal-dependent hydrolase (DUF457) [Actinoalloteichus sp. GBA129-24]